MDELKLISQCYNLMFSFCVRAARIIMMIRSNPQVMRAGAAGVAVIIVHFWYEICNKNVSSRKFGFLIIMEIIRKLST